MVDKRECPCCGAEMAAKPSDAVLPDERRRELQEQAEEATFQMWYDDARHFILDCAEFYVSTLNDEDLLDYLEEEE